MPLDWKTMSYGLHRIQCLWHMLLCANTWWWHWWRCPSMTDLPKCCPTCEQAISNLAYTIFALCTKRYLIQSSKATLCVAEERHLLFEILKYLNYVKEIRSLFQLVVSLQYKLVHCAVIFFCRRYKLPGGGSQILLGCLSWWAKAQTLVVPLTYNLAVTYSLKTEPHRDRKHQKNHNKQMLEDL